MNKRSVLRGAKLWATSWPHIRCPVSVRDGVLTVQVIQPAVRYELDRSWKRDIVRKLQVRFGAKVVREVCFRG